MNRPHVGLLSLLMGGLPMGGEAAGAAAPGSAAGAAVPQPAVPGQPVPGGAQGIMSALQPKRTGAFQQGGGFGPDQMGAPGSDVSPWGQAAMGFAGAFKPFKPILGAVQGYQGAQAHNAQRQGLGQLHQTTNQFNAQTATPEDYMQMYNAATKAGDQEMAKFALSNLSDLNKYQMQAGKGQQQKFDPAIFLSMTPEDVTTIFPHAEDAALFLKAQQAARDPNNPNALAALMQMYEIWKKPRSLYQFGLEGQPGAMQ